MANAITQQNDGEFIEYMALVRDHFDWVMYAKEAIANEDWQSLAGIWGDIDHDTMAQLFRAPTKGGIFTTTERAACKGNDAFNQAEKGVSNQWSMTTRTEAYCLRTTARKKETHPDYKGNYTDANGQEFWLSAWLKEGQKTVTRLCRSARRQRMMRITEVCNRCDKPAKPTEELEDDLPF